MAMTFLMVFSLIVIGAVTVFFFKSQNDKYHEERLERKERAIKTEMMYFSKEVETQDGEDVVIREFDQELLRLSEVHNMEINIYNVKGEMLISARPGIIHSEYVDRNVPRSALDQLKTTDRIVIRETMDEHIFLSDYTILRNSENTPIAILNLPYEQNEEVNQSDLPEFLGSIGVTYIFLFLAAIGLTFVLSNSITKNLSVIGQKMQSVDLAQANEPLDWKSEDEIGTLISSYNQMLRKLEESRDLMAKTERESAWREMARQVAHEIKNPLTPIKLSVQHLQATSDFDSPEWQEKFKATMGIIIQQIDLLTRIASDFSAFAKMNEGQNEKVNVNEAIRDTALLFADTPMQLDYKIPEETCYVQMDPDSLRRVLNNLVKNAKQALVEIENAKVVITAICKDDGVLISVSDNGAGVPTDMVSKIFQPNFTTKSGGTGLGLAICQQIAQRAGGSISLQTSEFGGATFCVVLPTT